MKPKATTTAISTATPKVFTTDDAVRKVRELIGGMIGVSSKSIKVKANYKLQRPELDIPNADKLSKEQKEAVAKAEELLALVILA